MTKTATQRPAASRAGRTEIIEVFEWKWKRIEREASRLIVTEEDGSEREVTTSEALRLIGDAMTYLDGQVFGDDFGQLLRRAADEMESKP